MRAILPDNNNRKHVALIAQRLEREPYQDFWAALAIGVTTFAELGLAHDAPDLLLWQTCQAAEVVLVTLNRHGGDPNALETVIRLHNTPTSLPVLTIASGDRLLHSSSYLDRVADRMLAYLLEIDNYRGTGRLWLP